jgi:hypothetical protein
VVPEEVETFWFNMYGINFGYRHDGTKIGGVQSLPLSIHPHSFVTGI